MKKRRQKQSRKRTKAETKDELESLPGVGPSIAKDLRAVGVTSVSGLVGRSPEALYEQLCQRRSGGGHVDRCVLYVFRCAVAVAETGIRTGPAAQWWRYSDRNILLLQQQQQQRSCKEEEEESKP